jgi:hypothetical protein
MSAYCFSLNLLVDLGGQYFHLVWMSEISSAEYSVLVTQHSEPTRGSALHSATRICVER